MTDEIFGMKIVLDENVPPNALYILDAKGKEFILRIIALQKENDDLRIRLNAAENAVKLLDEDLAHQSSRLRDAKTRITELESALQEITEKGRYQIPGTMAAHMRDIAKDVLRSTPVSPAS